MHIYRGTLACFRSRFFATRRRESVSTFPLRLF
nr:MAG TPA: hypothetical protein [Caudoviricetes sp.]